MVNVKQKSNKQLSRKLKTFKASERRNTVCSDNNHEIDKNKAASNKRNETKHR